MERPLHDHPEEWPTDQCSNCGADHDGFEVEYCEGGEHCDVCCTQCQECAECLDVCECDDE